MNEIRRARNRELFIDITCKVIEEEGIEAATIRNIADQAGYNSATLYSYFENLSQLILCAHLRYEKEILEMIMIQLGNEVNSYAEIWPMIYIIMARYYIAHPNAFECSYLYRNERGTEEKMRNYRKENSVLQSFVTEGFMRISKEMNRPIQEILMIHRSCISMMTGRLLLIIRGRLEEDKEMHLTELEQDIRKRIS